MGQNCVAVLEDHEADRNKILRGWQDHLLGLDLCEPFTRIREALDEAQRGSARG